LCQQTRPYAGVLDALSALRGHGLRLGVVTNKALEFTLPILAGLDLARYFEVVVGGDSLPQAKPHAAPLLYALQRLQCPPERALMVGDGPHDLLAAHAAGCPAVLVSYGYGHAEAHAADVQPLRVVDSLLELVGLIADD
jgi:phosphoglycolate phosphatase